MELLYNGFGNLFKIMLKLKSTTNIFNRNIIVEMIRLIENSFQNLLSDKLRQRLENSYYLIQSIRNKIIIIARYFAKQEEVKKQRP